jgi:tellurite resistance protein TerC
VIAWWQDWDAAMEYITGYLIEKSLSIDNVFLWAVIFTYFKVPEKFQHEVLFWGIFGALVMRAIFIFAGIALIENFDWIVYVFGILLLFTAYKLFTNRHLAEDPQSNKILLFIRKIVPQTRHYYDDKFVINRMGKRVATPLLTVLIIIELTDIVFAIDSIPAILAITRDHFIVFSSNAMAILGLRALYFLLADMKDRFIHLSKGLGIILAFVGIKFIISEWVHLPTWISLGFIAIVLTITVITSLKDSRQKDH